MPTSLRIPREKEKLVNTMAKKSGQTKTSFILEAVYEKIGLIKNRETVIRRAAGWMNHEETQALRESTAVFSNVDEDDWK